MRSKRGLVSFICLLLQNQRVALEHSQSACDDQPRCGQYGYAAGSHCLSQLCAAVLLWVGHQRKVQLRFYFTQLGTRTLYQTHTSDMHGTKDFITLAELSEGLSRWCKQVSCHLVGT